MTPRHKCIHMFHCCTWNIYVTVTRHAETYKDMVSLLSLTYRAFWSTQKLHCQPSGTCCPVTSTNIDLNPVQPVVLKDSVSLSNMAGIWLWKDTLNLLLLNHSRPVTTAYVLPSLSALTDACRLDGWLVRETVPLCPDTAINTHKAVCHVAGILSRGSHASYDTSVRARASCPHTKRWCGSLLNNLCFFTGVIG